MGCAADRLLSVFDLTRWPRWQRRSAPRSNPPDIVPSAATATGLEPSTSVPQDPAPDENTGGCLDQVIRTLPHFLSLDELASIDRIRLEAMCRAQAQPLYLGDHVAVCRALSRYKLFLDTRDRGFAAHVLLDGYWEMWLTRFLCRRIQSGMVVADVGANFGYYTLLLADLVGPDGHAFAIEPNPVVVTLLRQSILVNGFGTRTSIAAAAAGAEAGPEALLYSPHGEFKNARIVGSPDQVDSDQGTLHNVRQVRIDDLIASKRRLDFLKIDAEGSEETIIDGMYQCIHDYRPSFVLEFNAQRCKRPTELLQQLISIYQSVCYLDFDSELVPITETELLSRQVGEDWLLFFDRSTANR